MLCVSGYANLRLLSLQIQGYKRFGDSTLLRIRGRTLAVLGHNESGKTSLLMALAHLSRNGFAGATEFTDRTPRSASNHILTARFALETADIEAVEEALANRFVNGTISTGRHWHVFKRASGERRYETLMELTRDTEPRKQLAVLLQAASGSGWDLMPLSLQSDEQLVTVRDAMQRVAAIGSSDAQRLTENDLGALTSLKAEIDPWAEAAASSNAPLAELHRHLTRIEADERAELPSSTAAHTLFSRMPQFILFDEAARVLPSITPFTDSPSAALVNLLAAGGTTFEELASLAGLDDGGGELSELAKQVNLRLEELFHAWSQRRVCASH